MARLVFRFKPLLLLWALLWTHLGCVALRGRAALASGAIPSTMAPPGEMTRPVDASPSQPPPRPAQLPPQTPVADLGRNDGLLADAPLPRPLRLRPGQQLVLTYPLEFAAHEVDPYGWRFSDARQAWRMHAGQDLIAPQGSAVLAMLPGRVSLVDVTSGYGLTVVVDHGRGWQTLYAHLLDAAVQPGELVQAGQHLGRVGQSGSATTPHLHVELRRRQGDQLLALDPTPLLLQATPAIRRADPLVGRSQP